MIALKPDPGERALFARIAAKAGALASATAERRLRARRADPGRWRKAGLLWPLFGKDR